MTSCVGFYDARDRYEIQKTFGPTTLPKVTREVNGATKGSDLNMSTHVRDVTSQAIFPAIRTKVTLHIIHIYYIISLLAKATYITSNYISNHHRGSPSATLVVTRHMSMRCH